jgi:hypothetical protein
MTIFQLALFLYPAPASYIPLSCVTSRDGQTMISLPDLGTIGMGSSFVIGKVLEIVQNER